MKERRRIRGASRREAACRRLPQRHREASAPLRFPDLFALSVPAG
ncbi:hypothetical protein [Nostoc sp.]